MPAKQLNPSQLIYYWTTSPGAGETLDVTNLNYIGNIIWRETFNGKRKQ